jgi:DNA-binding SARP family transcriptional activator
MGMTEPIGASAPLEIRLFGPWEVRLRGVPLPPLRAGKARWLLALLVLHRGRPVERDRLAGLL